MKPSFEGDNFLTEVFPAEVEEINRRRGALGQVSIEIESVTPSSKHNLIGLCLSGGGIRSACFNLGVIQAAVEGRVFHKVDYLSTVSGGGYIGACVSAVLNDRDLSPKATTTTSEFPLHPDSKCEAPQHLQQNVNYLAPTGWLDLAGILVRLLRGGLANLVALLPYPLLAGFTLAVAMGFFGDTDSRVWTVNLSLLRLIWLALIAALLISAILNSKYRFSHKRRSSGGWILTKLLIAAVALSGLLMLPPCVSLLNRLITNPSSWLTNIGPILLSAFVLFHVSRRLARAKPRFFRMIGLTITWLLGPALLFAIVVSVAWWAWFGPDLFSAEEVKNVPSGVRTPANPQTLNRRARDCTLFAIAVSVIASFSVRLDINASSMHSVYRDALSRTFLFLIGSNKKIRTIWRSQTLATLIGKRKIETPVDEMCLSQLNLPGTLAPYHLINAAMNTPNSTNATLKERGAEFFLFSKRFMGSPSTGYCQTTNLEQAADWLDLGTASAISGAAVASNMGTHSLGELSFLLSILDARLGLWIPNPRFYRSSNLPKATPSRAQPGRLGNTITWIKSFFPVIRRGRVPLLYLFREITRKLDENLPFVNVSDGGHIENLGLYELLKRRCSIIVVADAEADPKIGFDGFRDARDYAHEVLDTNIDIDLNKLEIIPETCLSTEHVAVGTIKYPDGLSGRLIYLKSSLCEDDPPFLLERRRKDENFPHTPTSNQFFTQSDFEAYRKLGHHIATEAFARHYPK